jgi:metal-dependent amidase/aminoacylase/carboxypeptidase family protein
MGGSAELGCHDSEASEGLPSVGTSLNGSLSFKNWIDETPAVPAVLRQRYDADFRDKIIESMRRIVKGICDAHDATFEMEYAKVIRASPTTNRW